MKYHSALKIISVSLLALALLMAAGCGQKGNLYLPEKEQAVQRYTPA